MSKFHGNGRYAIPRTKLFGGLPPPSWWTPTPLCIRCTVTLNGISDVCLFVALSRSHRPNNNISGQRPISLV